MNTSKPPLLQFLLALALGHVAAAHATCTYCGSSAYGSCRFFPAPCGYHERCPCSPSSQTQFRHLRSPSPKTGIRVFPRCGRAAGLSRQRVGSDVGGGWGLLLSPRLLPRRLDTHIPARDN